MVVAILALQGAFLEHQQILNRLGVETFQVRNLDDWNREKDALVIPGGESTAILKILKDQGMLEPIRKDILAGMPVLGTCAGLIMLDGEHLGTMDIRVRRNAYGRQLGSFHTHAPFGDMEGDVPMTFIRAPYIESVGPDVQILAQVDGNIVAARQGNQLVTAFHPELDDDTRIHQMFLSLNNG